MGWTDERVEALKHFWTEGLSASQIADRLGGVTRNAVIGKVHRLKLESRGKTAIPAEPSVEAPVAANEAPATVAEPKVEIVEDTVVAGRISPAVMPSASPISAPRHQSYGATALKLDPEVDVEEFDEPETTTVEGEVVPIARKLSLVQLTERTCKWPVGDPMRDDFHFCGNPSRDSSPYCEFHAKLAFQAVDRRRVR